MINDRSELRLEEMFQLNSAISKVSQFVDENVLLQIQPIIENPSKLAAYFHENPQLRSGRPFEVESEDFNGEYEEIEDSYDSVDYKPSKNEKMKRKTGTKSFDFDDLGNFSDLDEFDGVDIKPQKILNPFENR
jgi:hypothetical protein